MNRICATRWCPVTAIAALTLFTVTGCNGNEPADPAPSRSGQASAGASSTPSTAPDGSTPASTPEANAPVGKRHLVDAAQAGGLQKLTGDGALSDLPVDPGEMRDGMTLVAGNYRAPGAQGEPVLFEGVDNVPEDTSRRREHLFRGMLDHIQWDPELGRPQAEPVQDAGPLGGSVECMLVSLSEDGNVICGWADEGTAAVALFPDSTLPEAEKQIVQLRSDLELQGS
jgi:hypothetical protein